MKEHKKRLWAKCQNRKSEDRRNRQLEKHEHSQWERPGVLAVVATVFMAGFIEWGVIRTNERLDDGLVLMRQGCAEGNLSKVEEGSAKLTGFYKLSNNSFAPSNDSCAPLLSNVVKNENPAILKILSNHRLGGIGVYELALIGYNFKLLYQEQKFQTIKTLIECGGLSKDDAMKALARELPNMLSREPSPVERENIKNLAREHIIFLVDENANLNIKTTIMGRTAFHEFVSVYGIRDRDFIDWLAAKGGRMNAVDYADGSTPRDALKASFAQTFGTDMGNGGEPGYSFWRYKFEGLSLAAKSADNKNPPPKWLGRF